MALDFLNHCPFKLRRVVKGRVKLYSDVYVSFLLQRLVLIVATLHRPSVHLLILKAELN